MSDLEKSYLDKPIIIIGAPRSGTSLLGKMLSKHPSLAYCKEPRLTWLYGNDGKSDMLRGSDARPEVCQHIRKFFATSVQAAGKQRLIEKTPSNALRLEFVDQVLPDCLFLHITRDGIESALSIRHFWNHRANRVKKDKVLQRLRELNLKRAPYYAKELLRRAIPRKYFGESRRPQWGPRIPGLGALVKELDVLEIACLQWRMCIENACHYGRQLPKDRYFECRLEDMSRELMESILEFCQLESSPEVWAGFEQDFRPKKTTIRRIETDPAELDTIRRWIEPTRQWLGQT